jgi:hypothetical protein
LKILTDENDNNRQEVRGYREKGQRKKTKVRWKREGDNAVREIPVYH